MWPFLRRAIRYVLCACHYRFRLYAESLSLCLRERESNQRESAPGIRVSLRETSLVPALLRGSSRWAIPGPSFLVWHPCQAPLYTAPPLGLLTGPGDRGACEICGSGFNREAFNSSNRVISRVRAGLAGVGAVGLGQRNCLLPASVRKRRNRPATHGRAGRTRRYHDCGPCGSGVGETAPRR